MSRGVHVCPRCQFFLVLVLIVVAVVERSYISGLRDKRRIYITYVRNPAPAHENRTRSKIGLR